MPDQTPAEPSANNSSLKAYVQLFSEVTKGMSAQPQYILIFILDFIFFLFSFGSGTYGLAKGQTLPLWMGLAALVLGLAAAVFVIYMTLKGRSESASAAPQKKLAVRQWTYYKVVHFTERGPQNPPVYQRVVERLNNQIVPVYDEVMCFTLMVYSSEQSRHKWDYRSSEVVDPHHVFPWIWDATPNDEGLSTNEGYSSQVFAFPSSTSLSQCELYNGIQPGKEDFSLKAACDIDEGRIIVDFSSIPGAEAFIQKYHASSKLDDAETSLNNAVETHKPALFTLSRLSMQEGQVLKIAFEIDWKKVAAARVESVH